MGPPKADKNQIVTWEPNTVDELEEWKRLSLKTLTAQGYTGVPLEVPVDAPVGSLEWLRAEVLALRSEVEELRALIIKARAPAPAPIAPNYAPAPPPIPTAIPGPFAVSQGAPYRLCNVWKRSGYRSWISEKFADIKSAMAQASKSIDQANATDLFMEIYDSSGTVVRTFASCHRDHHGPFFIWAQEENQTWSSYGMYDTYEQAYQASLAVVPRHKIVNGKGEEVKM